MEPQSAMCTATGNARRPVSWRTSSATASQASSLRLAITTSAPASANPSTIERPRPRLPPVISTTLSVKSLTGRSSELGRSLLPVRRQPFGGVGPAEPVELIGQRRVERRHHRPVPVVQGVLGPPDGALGAGGQADRHFEGPVLHLVVVDAQGHQADALGLLPRQRLAGEQVV